MLNLLPRYRPQRCPATDSRKVTSHTSALPFPFPHLRFFFTLTLPSQIHGFTGSSEVWKRNIPALSQKYRVIAPDLRGHGESDTTTYGYHVARLAMDLKEMIDHLKLSHGQIKVIAGSLGCAIIWSVMKPLAS
jgi:hypothetical protein